MEYKFLPNLALKALGVLSFLSLTACSSDNSDRFLNAEKYVQYIAHTQVLPADTFIYAPNTPNATTLFLAAPNYRMAAAADTWLATSAYPQGFTNQQIKDHIRLFAGTPDSNGNFAAFISLKGLVTYQAGDLGAYVTPEHHALGDPIWIIPMWMQDDYHRTHDLSLFRTYHAQARRNLENVPKDSAGMVVIPEGQLWRPWGFQDGLNKQGRDIFGNVFYFLAATAMAELYAANNDLTAASEMKAQADQIRAGISSLYDPGTGMFFSSSEGGSARNLDTFGSAFAVYSGITTPEQSASVSQYLISHYDQVVHPSGFIYQSPTIWGAIRPDLDWGVYDDGAWAYGMLWIVYAIAETNVDVAKNLLITYSYGSDITQEWWGRVWGSGKTNNFASIMQPLGAFSYLKTR